MSFYENQRPNTTSAYVDGVEVASAEDNSDADELTMIKAYSTDAVRFVERVIFGWGRVALVFRSREA